MYSLYDNAALPALSSLIRISAGHRIFAPHRSFSQLVTSFFGAMYLGILRMLFVAWSFLRTLSCTCLLISNLQKFYNFNSTNFNFFTVRNQTKLSAFFTRINQNQSVNCLLYLFSFLSLCSCQSSAFPRKSGDFCLSQREKLCCLSDSFYIITKGFK